jgi:hypothetical protein
MGLSVLRAILDHRARGLGRVGHRLRRQDCQHAIDAVVVDAGLQGDAVAFGISVAEDVNGIGSRPGGRQQLAELGHGGGGQLGQRDIDVGGMVGGHHAGPAAVGDDRQALAARAEMREQCRCGGIHLADVGQAHHAGATQGGIEYVVGADQGTGVRQRCLFASRMLADLDQQHRLAARRGAQGAHEAARILDAFDVKEDVLGARVGDHVVQHFAKVDVAFGAERNHV